MVDNISRMYANTFAKAVLMLLCLTVLSGCSVRTSSGQDGEAENELNVAVLSLPVTMDPQMAADTASIQHLDPCTGRLYRIDVNGELTPELCEKSTVSADGLTYTFTLRDDIYYSNGAPVTAEDFVFAIQRLAVPDNASPGIFVITDICRLKNVDEVAGGTLPPEMLGVSAPDERTLVIELAEPCPFLLSVVSMPEFSPCDKDFFYSCKGSYATSPETMLSSGPFMVDRYEPLGIQTHYVKNPYYVNAEKVSLSGLSLRQVANGQQAEMTYQSGAADIIPISGDYIELSLGDPGLMRKTGGGIYYLVTNYENKASCCQNKNIRTAISRAIDRESIVKNFMKSNGAPLTCIIPEGFVREPDGRDFGEDPSRYYDICGYDREAALSAWNKGLAELSVEEVTIELSAPAGSQQLIEIIKDQLEKTLPGLKLAVRLYTFQELQTNLHKGNFELGITGWFADYTDPNAFLGLFITGASANYGGYSDPEFDEIMKQSILENDPAVRMGLLHRAEDVIMEDMVFIPLYASGSNWLVSDRVGGVTTDATGGILYCGYAKKVIPDE